MWKEVPFECMRSEGPSVELQGFNLATVRDTRWIFQETRPGSSSTLYSKGTSEVNLYEIQTHKAHGFAHVLPTMTSMTSNLP